MNEMPRKFCMLPTSLGNFRMYDSGCEDVRIVCKGAIDSQGADPLVRVHSSCIASEVFGALDCDCADQLRESLEIIAQEGRGVVVHLQQEGRGHGLSRKIELVSKSQTQGFDTHAACEELGLEQDVRSYEAVVQLLEHLELRSVRLISNNPRKASFLERRGVKVIKVPTHPRFRKENATYLRVKNDKLGHKIPLDPLGNLVGPIRFYHSRQPWGEFSNFSLHAICVKETIWPTVEHFYQAQKFTDTPLEEEIRLCASPSLAKYTAKRLEKQHCRSDWVSVKETVMIEGLRAKFATHPDLRKMLLETRDEPIVECAKDDSYWGEGADGKGENRLGQLLMQVRSECRNSDGSNFHAAPAATVTPTRNLRRRVLE